MKIIKVESCTDCPYLLNGGRYTYCRKTAKDDVEAYKIGHYAEYANEIKFLFNACPLENFVGPASC